jgi:hypothetical protein
VRLLFNENGSGYFSRRILTVENVAFLQKPQTSACLESTLRTPLVGRRTSTVDRNRRIKRAWNRERCNSQSHRWSGRRKHRRLSTSSGDSTQAPCPRRTYGRSYNFFGSD